VLSLVGAATEPQPPIQRLRMGFLQSGQGFLYLSTRPLLLP
jgi:hypothetical protein